MMKFGHRVKHWLVIRMPAQCNTRLVTYTNKDWHKIGTVMGLKPKPESTDVGFKPSRKIIE
jgi:hypothetical protein